MERILLNDNKLRNLQTNLHLHATTGHKVWNAAKVLGEMLESNPSLVSGKTVLELGAGCALPSLLAAFPSLQQSPLPPSRWPPMGASPDGVIVRGDGTN